MRIQSLFQWGLIALLGALLLFAFTGILVTALVAFLSPEGLAFLLGFIGAWVFANRLLFGYGSFLIAAEGYLSKDLVEVEKLKEKTGEPKERLEGLSPVSLFALWLQHLEYFRYAYYGLFTLLLILMLLSKFNLLGAVALGNYLEGAFWGAAVITLFVFAFEITAGYLMERIKREKGATP